MFRTYQEIVCLHQLYGHGLAGYPHTENKIMIVCIVKKEKDSERENGRVGERESVKMGECENWRV